MKYKRLLIILGCILGVIILGVVLSFTLFRLKRVTLNFKNETTIYASQDSQDAIIRSGGFSYSTPIFNVNKNLIKQKLENENFYLKVINIETVFPCSIVVHCAEREELFSVKISDSLYYICDDELKILGMQTNTTTYASTNINAIYLDGVNVLNKSAKLGEKLVLDGNEDIVKNLANVFAYNNRTIFDMKAMFKSIEVCYDKHDFYTNMVETYLRFTTFDDFEIEIGLARCNLVEKVHYMLALIPNSYDKIGEYKLVIELDPDNPSNAHIRYEKLVQNSSQEEEDQGE